MAFTYNDPVVFLEYAVDTAVVCRERGIKSVAVTAGYVEARPRAELFGAMDAINIDLKGFTPEYYRSVCGGSLATVLESIEWAVHESSAWVELTTLIVPGHNDSDAELDRLTRWVADHCGPHVPMHFSAFHPDWKMLDCPPTPPETLTRARQIAQSNGIRYAYTGNVHDAEGDTTFCPGCNAAVIERDWYEVLSFDLIEGRCRTCGTDIAGVFEAVPGSWGRRRLPVRLHG